MRLTNSVEFLMSEDEDITAEQAMADIAENIQIETDITELAQKQMAMSGALGGNAARADAAMADAPHTELHSGAAAAPANDSLAGGA